MHKHTFAVVVPALALLLGTQAFADNSGAGAWAGPRASGTYTGALASKVKGHRLQLFAAKTTSRTTLSIERDGSTIKFSSRMHDGLGMGKDIQDDGVGEVVTTTKTRGGGTELVVKFAGQARRAQGEKQLNALLAKRVEHNVKIPIVEANGLVTLRFAANGQLEMKSKISVTRGRITSDEEAISWLMNALIRTEVKGSSKGTLDAKE